MKQPPREISALLRAWSNGDACMNLVQCQDRAHFFGIAARLMRRILVDLARSRHALNALAGFDPRKGTGSRAAVFRRPERRRDRGGIEGLSITVIRDWNMAKPWLLKELKQE